MRISRTSTVILFALTVMFNLAVGQGNSEAEVA